MNGALLQAVQRVDPELVSDLLDEIGAKNSLMVTVYRGIRCEAGVRHKRTFQERFPVVPTTAALFRQDVARMRAGLKPLYAIEALRRRGAESALVVPNLRTNVGVDFCAANLGGTSVAVADTIALSANSGGASATHGATTAPWSTAQTSDGTTGEFTTYGGMARAAATYAHTVGGPSTGNASYTMSKTFTATATVTNVRLAGLFGGSGKASQGGTDAANMLVVESTFTATTLNNTDQLALTWTLNI